MVFQRARNRAFQIFLNKCPESASNIANYVDFLMRKGLKGLNEGDIEARIDATIRLFVCLDDRDVFLKCYNRHLSKRLLDGTTVSDDAERTMILKLTV